MFRLSFTSLLVAANLAGLCGCKGPQSQSSGSEGGAGLMGGMTSGGASYHGRAATPQDVFNSTTADLNGDGFVTLDEIVAMKQAGLTDDQMIERLRATNQIYQLTPAQEAFLRRQGISSFVIMQMETINRDQQQPGNSGGGVASPPGSAVISVPPPEQPPTP